MKTKKLLFILVVMIYLGLLPLSAQSSKKTKQSKSVKKLKKKQKKHLQFRIAKQLKDSVATAGIDEALKLLIQYQKQIKKITKFDICMLLCFFLQIVQRSKDNCGITSYRKKK